MKILIVGGGIGGLTLAAFLENSNIDYEIIEKSSVAEQTGYYLVTWRNARDILEKLDLANEYDSLGAPIQNYSMRDGRGRVLRNHSLRNFRERHGMAMRMIPREGLRNLLQIKVDASKILMGVTLVSIKEITKSVQVEFSNGDKRLYDAVIGADGIHSSVRSLVFKKDAEKYESWRQWWTWIDNAYNSPETLTEYVEPGKCILVFNTGKRSLAILTAPQNHETWDPTEGRVRRLREIFKTETAIIPEAIAYVRDEGIMPIDVAEIEMKDWTKGHVALLGDAAHCFGPHAGLGASMAMEDAYVLAQQLLRANVNGIERALQDYQKRRAPRINSVRNINKTMYLWTLVESKIIRKLLNILAPHLPASLLLRGYDNLLKEKI